MTDTSELIQLIAALVLFGLLAMSVNNTINNNTEVEIRSELDYNGIAVGQSYIDEVRVKAFDDATVEFDPTLVVPDDFSTTMGVEGIEDANDKSTYDDIDDYHGYSESVETYPGITYQVSISVNYVTAASNYKTETTTRTNHKRLEVKVVSLNELSESTDSDTLRLSFVKSHY